MTAAIAAVHIKSLDKALARNYCFRMVIKSIREFNRAVPFVPYEIHTASGESYEVPHPDFISISPRGSYVIIIGPGRAATSPQLSVD